MTITSKRPSGLKLDEAATRAIEKAGTHKGVKKTAVSMKAAEGGDLAAFETMRPSDDQLDKINQFTRSKKTADDVLVFPTLSCNDIYDRDDEGFQKGAIDQMHALEAPYSFVGKSFLMDHDHSVSKAIGRIFDEEVVTEQGIKFLKHEIYMPNTDQFKGIAEKIDFGLQWAVSVGLVLDTVECSICDSPVYQGWGMSFCMESGHEKGLFYDPKDPNFDEDGWATPVDPTSKGAVKAMVDLYDPRDGYELSSVFLGAQYYAQLAKEPGFKGVIKAAAAGGVPIIGLSHKEAEELPLLHESEIVQEARDKYEVTADEDGDPTWTDENGLRWVYQVETSQVLALGKAPDGDINQEEDNGSTSTGEELRPDGDEDGPDQDGLTEAGVGRDSDGLAGGSAEGGEVVGVGDPEPGLTTLTDDEVADADLITFLTTEAEEAGVPEEVLVSASVKSARTPSAFSKALLTEVSKTISAYKVLAEVGEIHLRELRVEAIDMYTRAHIGTDTKGVDTTVFEKLLDKVGGDVELLKSMIDEQKSLAQAKFPASVRRSSFEKDANTGDVPVPVGNLQATDLIDESNDKTIEFAHRIHQ